MFDYYYDLIVEVHKKMYGTLSKEEIELRIIYLQNILYY